MTREGLLTIRRHDNQVIYMPSSIHFSRAKQASERMSNSFAQVDLFAVQVGTFYFRKSSLEADK